MSDNPPLTEVRPGHAFDTGPLEVWLVANAPDGGSPIAVRQFAGGQSNPTFLIEMPKARYVLRRKPQGALLQTAHAVDREFRIISALWRVGYPVPEPIGLCADDAVIGSMFYVMRYIEGRLFVRCTMPQLSRTERTAVYDSANAALALLHELDPADLGLSDFGRQGNYFTRQIARWSKQYQASRTADIPEMDKLIAWLPGAAPDEARARIVHGDYSFHNILFHPREPRVAAVLDWELSTTGDPLGDLMYHAMEWYRPAGIDRRGTLLGENLSALGIPDLEAYIARYCARTGRVGLDNLCFHRAYNLFRVAAILQGIVGRARDGTATADNAALLETRVQPLATAAWRAAQAAGAV